MVRPGGIEPLGSFQLIICRRIRNPVLGQDAWSCPVLPRGPDRVRFGFPSVETFLSPLLVGVTNFLITSEF